MTDKRRQWDSIKGQAPELADWLTEINKAFGKPAALRVELASGEVIESGVFKVRHPRLDLGRGLK